MNLSQIELLQILQETQLNLSKAADKMHVVQSAVSRQLQLFEQELGSPLFERQGKKLIALTPLGVRVMQEISVISQAKQNIKAIAADSIDSNKGIIHIATTHAQAKYFLPKPIKRFREKYPGVGIYMMQTSPTQLIGQLHSHHADIAICTEKVSEDDSLVTRHCYAWHHAAVMPKDHALCLGELTLAALAAHPILTYNIGYTGRSNIELAYNNTEAHLDIVLAAADSDVIKTYVRLGLGVGLIAGMAYDPVLDNDLTARDLSHLIPCSITKIAYLKKHYLPLYTQHFIEELLFAAQEIKGYALQN
ncbi:MAG: LysR substrate-binding domain-containing protein [Methylococcaceae bacterium]|jgi:DNA-binding transcriptional LysR family regulator